MFNSALYSWWSFFYSLLWSSIMSIDPHLNYNLLCTEWFVNRTIDHVSKYCRFVNILSVTSFEFKSHRYWTHVFLYSKGYQLIWDAPSASCAIPRPIVANAHLFTMYILFSELSRLSCRKLTSKGFFRSRYITCVMLWRIFNKPWKLVTFPPFFSWIFNDFDIWRVRQIKAKKNAHSSN